MDLFQRRESIEGRSLHSIILAEIQHWERLAERLAREITPGRPVRNFIKRKRRAQALKFAAHFKEMFLKTEPDTRNGRP